MNSFLYSGRLTADIETREAGEHQVHQFTVAINQGERATFVPTEAWDMPHLERYLGKGSRVLVRGALKQDSWQTEGGEKRSRLLATAYEVEFLDGRETSPEEPPARPRKAPANRPPKRRSGSVRETSASYATRT